MSKYWLVLLLSGLVPFILSFYPKLKFYKNFLALIKTISLILLIFGLWDVLATFRGHWWFNPKAVVNFKVINLPLEEVMFFIIIPFCALFTWEVIKFMKNKLK